MPTHEPSSLTTLPTPNDNYFPTSVTIGDLHGNTLKFIHFLIKEGIIGFKSTNAEDHHQAYQELFQSYADAEQFFTNQKGNVIVGLDGNPLQISRDPVGRIDLYDTDYYGMKTAIDRYKTGEIHVKLSEKIRAFESSPENIRKYRAIDDRFNAFLTKIEVKNKNTNDSYCNEDTSQ